ncbi:hypothetical protein LguiA_008259 [Lonicera macranthoides]
MEVLPWKLENQVSAIYGGACWSIDQSTGRVAAREHDDESQSSVTDPPLLDVLVPRQSPSASPVSSMSSSLASRLPATLLVEIMEFIAVLLKTGNEVAEMELVNSGTIRRTLGGSTPDRHPPEDREHVVGGSEAYGNENVVRFSGIKCSKACEILKNEYETFGNKVVGCFVGPFKTLFQENSTWLHILKGVDGWLYYSSTWTSMTSPRELHFSGEKIFHPRTSRTRSISRDILEVLNLKDIDHKLAGGAISDINRQKLTMAKFALGKYSVMLYDQPFSGSGLAAIYDLVGIVRTISRIRQSSASMALTQISQEVYDLFDRISWPIMYSDLTPRE